MITVTLDADTSHLDTDDDDAEVLTDAFPIEVLTAKVLFSLVRARPTEVLVTIPGKLTANVGTSQSTTIDRSLWRK